MSDSSSQKYSHTDNSQELPTHIAVIMDGNGRWAKNRGLPRIAGHQKGVESVRRIISTCAENKIGYLTLFAFSSENWQRPEKEVNLLLDLFLKALEKEVSKLHENDICFRVIGDIEPFGPRIVERIKASEALTHDNSGLVVTIAANYGGRWDITQACQKLAREVEEEKIKPEQISSELIAAFLSTNNMPEPDLFIRSGGEKRISNFLLWQLAYTELYFTDVLWPDFDDEEFKLAINSYQNRERRFGQISEQIKGAGNA